MEHANKPILTALYELHERMVADTETNYGIAPAGYSIQKVAFKIVIDPEGRLVGIQDTTVADGKRRRSRQVRVLGAAKSTSSKPDPCTLWDNPSYLLGVPKPGWPEHRRRDDSAEEEASAQRGHRRDSASSEEFEKARRRSAEQFAASRDHHLRLEHEVDAPAFSAVCRFMERWEPEHGIENDEVAALAKGPAGFGVFQVVGEPGFVHEDPAVRRWWQRRVAERGDSSEEARGQCLVTGATNVPIARLHEPKIKGIRGGQSSGGVLVGFKPAAFKSYGLDKSYNAPVSVAAASAYAKALNAMLDGPQSRRHCRHLAGSTVVFWTDRPSAAEDIFAVFAADGVPDQKHRVAQDEGMRTKLEVFLEALRRGREAGDDAPPDDGTETHYYLLGLSPNAARVSVRFFEQGSVARLLSNLRGHFEAIDVVRPPGESEFPSLRRLLAALTPWRATKAGRPGYDYKAPDTGPPRVLAGPLLRAIVCGVPYPAGVFVEVVRRVRADRHIDSLRVGLLKGYLQRNKGMEVSMSLDRNRMEPAYRLGRLFAALEKTQKDALGENLNATIRDRFYGAASASPQAVFPRLLRTYQHHLGKMEGGLKRLREREVQEILAPLADFPPALDLAAQGLFAIGYYHQIRDFYTKREDRAR